MTVCVQDRSGGRDRVSCKYRLRLRGLGAGWAGLSSRQNVCLLYRAVAASLCRVAVNAADRVLLCVWLIMPLFSACPFWPLGRWCSLPYIPNRESRMRGISGTDGFVGGATCWSDVTGHENSVFYLYVETSFSVISRLHVASDDCHRSLLALQPASLKVCVCPLYVERHEVQHSNLLVDRTQHVCAEARNGAPENAE